MFPGSIAYAQFEAPRPMGEYYSPVTTMGQSPSPLDSFWMTALNVLPSFFLLLLLLSLIYLLMKKAPSKFWENFGRNLKVVYLYVASFVGLVLFIFNGVTLTKTLLEETVFPVDYEYANYYECENKYTPDGKAVTQTEADRTACEARVLERAKTDRGNQVNRMYAEGLAGVIFGLILWIPHFRWARKA